MYLIKIDRDIISKIGQYPSIADLSTYDVEKYQNVLSKEKLGEFKRAVGLAAHGIGIGSFVYLRRIIEDLVEEAHCSAKSEKNWDEDAYSRGRMDEKIKFLGKEYLPEFLVRNRKIFSILSKGIHELSEDECLTFFSPLKIGIELILNEKMEQEEKEKKIESVQEDIDQILSKIQGK